MSELEAYSDAYTQENADILESENRRLRQQILDVIERCAKIAGPWPGFWPQDDATETDKAVIAVRKEIAKTIRAIADEVRQ
jgi:hypothetical protein